MARSSKNASKTKTKTKNKKDEKDEKEKNSSEKGTSQSSNSQNSNFQNSKQAVKKKGISLKKKLGCAAAGCLVFLILSCGFVAGGYSVPRVQEWLVDHNFLTEEDATDGDEDSGGWGWNLGGSDSGNSGPANENFAVDVVDEVSDGVVSIAVAEASIDPQSGDVEDSTNIGTGFVIDDSGLVMTNQHVVSRTDADYIVVTSDGDEHEVTKVARDDVNDLAILEVEGNGLQALTLGDSDELEVGQAVVAIGTPLGEFPGSVTSGIVSGIGRSVTAGGGGYWSTSRVYEDVIQTDAAVNPGNSGGPLLDSDGNVIGINFATTSGADNISFAIPVNRAKEKISEYKENGKFIKPFLGVEYRIITPNQAMFYSDVVAGALVSRVVDGSPADEADIKRGDIITEIAGDDVGASLSVLIQKHEVGEEIEVRVWRDGKIYKKSVTLVEAE